MPSLAAVPPSQVCGLFWGSDRVLLLCLGPAATRTSQSHTLRPAFPPPLLAPTIPPHAHIHPNAQVPGVIPPLATIPGMSAVLPGLSAAGLGLGAAGLGLPGLGAIGVPPTLVDPTGMAAAGMAALGGIGGLGSVASSESSLLLWWSVLVAGC